MVFSFSLLCNCKSERTGRWGSLYIALMMDSLTLLQSDTVEAVFTFTVSKYSRQVFITVETLICCLLYNHAITLYMLILRKQFLSSILVFFILLCKLAVILVF